MAKEWFYIVPKEEMVEKGGKGSGWFAPPKGTHEKKGKPQKFTGSGKAAIQIVKPGSKLPKSKIKQEAIILLDTRNQLIIGDPNRTHAEIINQIGENKNFDRIVRGGIRKKNGKLRLEVWTSYSGIGQNVFGQSADIAAARNIKRLVRAMMSAGYSPNMELIWYPIDVGPASSTMSAWKTFVGKKIPITLANFIVWYYMEKQSMRADSFEAIKWLP